MLSKGKSLWLFIRMNWARLISWKRRPLKRLVSLANLYRRCSETPMSVFIQCMCEEDYQALVISGKANSNELTEAWVLLLSEYQELKGDSIDNIEQMRLTKGIWKLRNHLQIVDYCTQFLSERYSESIADSLCKLGYVFKPTEKEPHKYISLLNNIINKTKLKYVQLQQMVKQLEEELKNTQRDKPTRESFETTLIHIEEMQKTSYDLDTITAYKYVMLEKKMARQIELLQTKAQWQTQKG